MKNFFQPVARLALVALAATCTEAGFAQSTAAPNQSVAVPIEGAKPPSSIQPSVKQSSKVETKTRVRRDHSRPSGLGIDGHFGLFGATSVSKSEFATDEPERSGSELGLRAMVSMISGSFGVGAAIGYLQSELVANKSELEKFSTFAEDDVRRKEKVETKSTFVEFYPHFRPGENWQIGPVARAVLSPYQNSLPEESRKKQTIFAGALVGFEFPSDRWIYRIGGQYLTDINLERRSLQHFQISLDIGYSFLERFSKIVERKKIEKREERIKNVVEKNIEKKVILKQVSIIFDQGTINFVTAKADLLPASIAKLQKLSRFLTSRPDLWERVLIEGHTDRRGAFDYNIKLSQDRAISVGQALIQNGVQQSKISWQGFGYSRPLDPGDSEVAWARNRRVELKFEGVADEDALKAGVSEAMAGN